MKVCKRCKYFKRNFPFFWDYEFAECTRKEPKTWVDSNPVSGYQVQRKETRYCEIERRFEHQCGREGKYYEAR